MQKNTSEIKNRLIPIFVVLVFSFLIYLTCKYPLTLFDLLYFIKKCFFCVLNVCKIVLFSDSPKEKDIEEMPTNLQKALKGVSQSYELFHNILCLLFPDLELPKKPQPFVKDKLQEHHEYLDSLDKMIQENNKKVEDLHLLKEEYHALVQQGKDHEEMMARLKNSLAKRILLLKLQGFSMIRFSWKVLKQIWDKFEKDE